MSNYLKVLAVTGGLLLATLPVMAHHSIASEFDFNKELELKGTLKRMDWITPHPILHLEVTNQDGTKTTWLFQSANSLLGTGVTAVLRRAPSQGGLEREKTYTFTGFQAKNGKSMAFLKAVKMEDGRVVTAWFGDPNGE
jgi:hypothetical protein